MNEKKHGYLKIHKDWGECECGCKRRIAPPSLMCIVHGFFYIATHETEADEKGITSRSMRFVTIQDSQPLINEEAQMATPKKKAVPKTDTTEKKPVTPVAKKAVEPSKESALLKQTKAAKEPKVPKITANSLCRELLLERAYTDQQIFEKISKVFPDSKFTQGYISTCRIDMNKGYYKKCLVDKPIVRLVELDGKIVPAEEASKVRAASAEEKRSAIKAKKTVDAAAVPKAAKKVLLIKKEQKTE
jgi:hypothetical protein